MYVPYEFTPAIIIAVNVLVIVACDTVLGMINNKMNTVGWVGKVILYPVMTVVLVQMFYSIGWVLKNIIELIP